MKLPNGERAVIDVKKLRNYCLDADHRRGKHKALVFATTLGIDARHSDWLRNELLQAALVGEAKFTFGDQWGDRYYIDSLVGGPLGTSIVRSLWIVRRGEDFPRLASCYVL